MRTKTGQIQTCPTCGNKKYFPKCALKKINYCSYSCVRKGKKLTEKHKNILKGFIGVLAFNWKGDKAKNNAQHMWIVARKGKPQKCEHCGIEEKRMYHWANVDHKYRRILEDYIRLCVPCHRKYDYKKFGLGRIGNNQFKKKS